MAPRPFRAARRTLPEIPGLRDYRAILRAHAEDSAHTGGTRPEVLAETRRAGISAILLTDHHRPPKDFICESWNMRSVSAALRPGIRELTRGHEPGDIIARLDLDPYHRSFQNVSTHLLAPELTENAVRDALREGRAYVSHDWACDPSGFRFEIGAKSPLKPPSHPHGCLIATTPLSAPRRALRDLPVA
jgi:hypothetical protein